MASETERHARVFHFKVDVLQLFVSLNLQNDRIPGAQPTHRSPQLLDGVRWRGIQRANHVAGLEPGY
jgi:hypothetical protein